VTQAPVPLGEAWPLAGTVIHVFTHFRLELAVLAGIAAEPASTGTWVMPKDFADHALPTLMKKVARHALAAEKG